MNPKMQLKKEAYLGTELNQDFLVYFDGGHNLELEQSLTKVWVFESPESSSPLLKDLGSISSNSLIRALEFPKTKQNRKHTKLGLFHFLWFSKQRVN